MTDISQVQLHFFYLFINLLPDAAPFQTHIQNCYTDKSTTQVETAEARLWLIYKFLSKGIFLNAQHLISSVVPTTKLNSFLFFEFVVYAFFHRHPSYSSFVKKLQLKVKVRKLAMQENLS
jgi:hypothetical protein